MKTPARSGLLAAALVGALTLSACGGATVENDTATATSVAPLERAPRSSTATETSSAASESASASASASAEPSEPGRPPRPQPQPQDQGAREIDEVPAGEIPRSSEDVHYLGELSDEKIDIDGVEDQLIGTAATVCRGGDEALVTSTLPAVAGQLIEQGRTDKSVEDVTAIIESAAKNAYC